MLYNRFSDIKLPDYLAFFGGRRFVPIVAGAVGLVFAVIFGIGFPYLEAGIDQLSYWVVESGNFGLFAYGFLNRILIVTGLHHIINNIAWFILGDFHGTTGDLKRFFAGDPTAGAFMAGFFPIMMFGLPAACLAMYHSALPDRRKAVAGLLVSLALTSFLTGVTEPIEFSFMFLAPALYLVHAVLTGFSMVVMNLLGVKLGFGFSAGLFDYVLGFGIATRPALRPEDSGPRARRGRRTPRNEFRNAWRRFCASARRRGQSRHRRCLHDPATPDSQRSRCGRRSTPEGAWRKRRGSARRQRIAGRSRADRRPGRRRDPCEPARRSGRGCTMV
jgi:hypothetical protein